MRGASFSLGATTLVVLGHSPVLTACRTHLPCCLVKHGILEMWHLYVNAMIKLIERFTKIVYNKAWIVYDTIIVCTDFVIQYQKCNCTYVATYLFT